MNKSKQEILKKCINLDIKIVKMNDNLKKSAAVIKTIIKQIILSKL